MQWRFDTIILHMWSEYKAWIVVQFVIHKYQCTIGVFGVLRCRWKCTKNDAHGALRVIATFVKQTLMTICFPLYTRGRGCRLIRRSRTLYIVYINIYYIIYIYILNSYVIWPLFPISNNKLIRHRFSGCARRHTYFSVL